MAFFLRPELRVVQFLLALLAINDYLLLINSEQAGRPRSSRRWRMNDRMIRNCDLDDYGGSDAEERTRTND